MSSPFTTRRGFSLLETLMASTVLAVVLVPALAAMKRGLELARDVEAVQLTTTLCVSKMEEQLAIVSYGFSTASLSGSFAADGYPSFRFTVLRTDALLSGGIPNRLMAVSVTVWQDDNGNSAIDTGEISTSLSTKTAKMAIYELLSGAP